MNPSVILETIKQKLFKANHESILQEIDNKISEGSSSNEIWMIVGFYLKHLDQVNIDAYKLVKVEIEDLDNCLWSIGLKLS